jgi:hypothetical protein
MRSVSEVRISRRLCQLAPLPAGCHPVAAQQLETNEMAAYQIYADSGSAYSEPLPTFLDGDPDRIRPSGYNWIHPEGREFRSRPHPGGGWSVTPHFAPQGVPVETTFLPRKIRWFGRKRQLNDILDALAGFLVSHNFRQIVETFEPGVHQFVPVDIMWKDGESAGEYYWLYCCTRLDSMDREHSTMKFDTEQDVWDHVPGGSFVVNLKQVGNHHVWHDNRIHGSSVLISGHLKEAFEAAGITGAGYRERPTV